MHVNFVLTKRSNLLFNIQAACFVAFYRGLFTEKTCCVRAPLIKNDLEWKQILFKCQWTLSGEEMHSFNNDLSLHAHKSDIVLNYLPVVLFFCSYILLNDSAASRQTRLSNITIFVNMQSIASRIYFCFFARIETFLCMYFSFNATIE